MSTAYLYGYYDAWYTLFNASKYGNGGGPRLQVGYAVDTGGNTWQNRVGIGFIDPGIPAGAVITSAKIRLTVRGTHSCFSKGGSPKFYVERVVDPSYIITENSENGECAISAAGTIDNQRWAGPDTTATNRGSYEGSPSVGAVIEVDILDAFNDWIAARGGSDDVFCVVLKCHSETAANQRIAFESVEGTANPIYLGGDGSDMVVEYSTAVAPDAPSISLTPTARQTAPGSRTFTGDMTSDEAADLSAGPTSVLIEVSRSVGMTSPIHNSNSASGITYNSGTRRWSVTRAFTEPRDGALYYWRCKITGVGGQSAYSAVKSYPINRLPTVTKVRPVP